MKYYIFDWIGNRIGHKEFKSFEAGWDYILGELTDKLGLTEDDYCEYFVEAKKLRNCNRLDPNDAWEIGY